LEKVDVTSRNSDWAILLRMARQAKPYWPHVFLIFLLSLASTPLALLLPLPLKIVIDNVIGLQPLPAILVPLIPNAVQTSGTLLLVLAAGLLVVVTLLTHLQGLANWLLQTYVGEALVLDFRTRLFGHVQKLSLTYHDSKGVADSVYRIEHDAPSLQYVTINGVIPLVAACLMLASMIYVTAQIDLRLALIALGISPLLFVLAHVFRERLRDRWRDVKRLESSASSVVQEVLGSMRVVKAFGRERHEQSRFWHRSTRRMQQLLKVSFLQGGYDLLIGVTVASGSAIVLFVGVRDVQSGILSLGDLLLVMGYIGQLYEPLRSMSKKLADLQSGLASAERAFALLDEQPDVAERSGARSLARAHGAIAFDDVSFAYEHGRPVLVGVNLDIPAGARVGIQGKTGAGKSTLMSLLVRFYDASAGSIRLDGLDIRDYRLADLRNQFAIVLQDPVLFSASVAENIAYGRPDATEQQIAEAARLANSHEFISKLPDGYATLVGERGMRLSGGERQRISLARAFLKDAPILILDEPTSSVDVGTEAAILDALERLMHGRTTFMIAHRLGTLDGCDFRLQIKGGRLLPVTSVAA
jgi:ATP-binding cassette subfamily B protein